MVSPWIIEQSIMAFLDIILFILFVRQIRSEHQVPQANIVTRTDKEKAAGGRIQYWVRRLGAITCVICFFGWLDPDSVHGIYPVSVIYLFSNIGAVMITLMGTSLIYFTATATAQMLNMRIPLWVTTFGYCCIALAIISSISAAILIDVTDMLLPQGIHLLFYSFLVTVFGVIWYASLRRLRSIVLTHQARMIGNNQHQQQQQQLQRRMSAAALSLVNGAPGSRQREALMAMMLTKQTSIVMAPPTASPPLNDEKEVPPRSPKGGGGGGICGTNNNGHRGSGHAGGIHSVAIGGGYVGMNDGFDSRNTIQTATLSAGGVRLGSPAHDTRLQIIEDDGTNKNANTNNNNNSNSNLDTTPNNNNNSNATTPAFHALPSSSPANTGTGSMATDDGSGAGSNAADDLVLPLVPLVPLVTGSPMVAAITEDFNSPSHVISPIGDNGSSGSGGSGPHNPNPNRLSLITSPSVRSPLRLQQPPSSFDEGGNPLLSAMAAANGGRGSLVVRTPPRTPIHIRPRSPAAPLTAAASSVDPNNNNNTSNPTPTGATPMGSASGDNTPAVVPIIVNARAAQVDESVKRLNRFTRFAHMVLFWTLLVVAVEIISGTSNLTTKPYVAPTEDAYDFSYNLLLYSQTLFLAFLAWYSRDGRKRVGSSAEDIGSQMNTDGTMPVAVVINGGNDGVSTAGGIPMATGAADLPSGVAPIHIVSSQGHHASSAIGSPQFGATAAPNLWQQRRASGGPGAAYRVSAPPSMDDNMMPGAVNSPPPSQPPSNNPSAGPSPIPPSPSPRLPATISSARRSTGGGINSGPPVFNRRTSGGIGAATSPYNNRRATQLTGAAAAAAVLAVSNRRASGATPLVTPPAVAKGAWLLPSPRV